MTFVLSNMNSEGKEHALRAVEGLQARGSTNLSGGLFAGMLQAQGKELDLPLVTEHEDATNSNMRRKVVPTKNSSKLSWLKSCFTSNSAVDAKARPQEPSPAPVPGLKFSASHVYSSVKVDGKAKHKYTIVVSIPTAAVELVESVIVLPSRGTPIPIAVAPEATADIVIDTALNDVKVSIRFKSSTKLNNVELEWTPPTNPTGAFKEVPIHRGDSAPTSTTTTTSAKTLSYVWLFTDGQANAGITDPAALVAETRKRLEGSGITGIYTFGFGASHNSNLLQAIAEASQGSYFFIRTTELIKEVFANCLGGLLSIVAHHIVLKFTPAAGTVVKKVLSTLPFETASDSTIVINMKDLYSEEQRDLLVELTVNGAAVGPLTMGTWTLQWQDSNSEAQTITAPSAVETVEFLPPGLACNAQVDEQRNRILATKALDEARKAADSGDVQKANDLVDKVVAQIQASESAACPASAAVYEDLKRAKVNMSSRSRWEAEGSKVVGQMQNMHAMQRSNALECCDAYETKAKKSMKSKMSLF